MKSLTIIGKRWFQKGPGNTYHSAYALIDGKPVDVRIDYAYGYGNSYEDSMMKALASAGLLPNPVAAHESAWRYCERNGITYVTDVTDVQRKKDL